MARLIIKDGKFCIVGGGLVTDENGAPCACGPGPGGPSEGFCTLVLQRCVDTSGDNAYFLVDLTDFDLEDWLHALDAAVIHFANAGCYVVVGYIQLGTDPATTPAGASYLFPPGVIPQATFLTNCNAAPCSGGANECGTCNFPNQCFAASPFSGSAWDAVYGRQSVCLYGAITVASTSISYNLNEREDVGEPCNDTEMWTESVTYNSSSYTRWENPAVPGNANPFKEHTFQESGSGTRTRTVNGVPFGNQISETYSRTQTNPTTGRLFADFQFGGLVGAGTSQIPGLAGQRSALDLWYWAQPPVNTPEEARARRAWRASVISGEFGGTANRNDDVTENCEFRKATGSLSSTSQIGSGYRNASYTGSMNSDFSRKKNNEGGPGCPGLTCFATRTYSKSQSIQSTRRTFFYKQGNEPPAAGGQPCRLIVSFLSCTLTGERRPVDVSAYETIPEVVAFMVDGVRRCFSITEDLDYINPPQVPDAVFSNCDDCQATVDRSIESMTDRNNRILREQGFDAAKETRALKQGGDCGCSQYTYS